MDRGAWWVTVHGVARSQTQLNTHIVMSEDEGIRSQAGSWEVSHGAQMPLQADPTLQKPTIIAHRSSLSHSCHSPESSTWPSCFEV